MHFDPAALIALNAILACMMYGVALSLKVDDFARILRDPTAPLIGLAAQFLLLPAATCLATWALDVDPELALGMILVAACPGGNFSNIMTWLGRANVAASVSMTAVSSLAATVLTPLNFALYGWLNPHTRALVSDIALDPLHILLLVAAVLALPLIFGMTTAHYAPRFAQRAEKPLRTASLFVLLAFVAIAFAQNMGVFIANADRIAALVIGHNTLALSLGALAGYTAGLSRFDRRAVTMEVGIQNSGLGLSILFTFFPQASGMILITAFWGTWHLISGLTLAMLWARSERNAHA